MCETTTLLELKNISYSYNEQTQSALSDISLSIRSADYVALVGANGSGKSTLGLIMSGLKDIQTGSLSFNGKTVVNVEKKYLDRKLYTHFKQSVGAMFQNPEDQIICQQVDRDVAFGAENKGIKTETLMSIVQAALHKVGLSNRKLANPLKLSGGQQQRTALAGILALDREVVVADEPSAMLDVANRHYLMQLFDQLNAQGKTIVHITHDLDEAARAKRVIALENGTVIFDGAYQDFIADRSLVEKMFPDTQQDILKPVLSKSYTKGAELFKLSDVAVEIAGQSLLRGVNLSIHEHEFISITGSTGSGKTTLSKLLCCLITPAQGSVMAFGCDLTKKKNHAIIQGKVGYVMQFAEHQLFGSTVLEDVAFGPTQMGATPENARKQAQDALATVGLPAEKYGDRSCFDLSGGQKKRVALAGVLAIQPRVLLLDEPASGLDVLSQNYLMELLGDLRAQGMTIIMITHNMDHAAQSDRMIVLGNKSIALDNSPDTLFTQHGSELKALGIGLPRKLEGFGGINDSYCI